MLGITALTGVAFFVYSSTVTTDIKVQNNLVIEKNDAPQEQNLENNFATSSSDILPELEEYSDSVPHIFFHSLIIYPEKAASDVKNSDGYKNNMITVDQFKIILQQLYENNFILIDSQLLYSFDENGSVTKPTLYIPKGKRPLVLSVDDLSYNSYLKNGGFADKLVLEEGIVKTEVLTPEGNKIMTNDGDVVPIVDEFVKAHPDFSLNGAKGIIGLTGFEGIFGYRTQLLGERGDNERKSAIVVVDALKKTGWTFANHSYSHRHEDFLQGTISTASLAKDISLWIEQVEPLVGQTDIFIGPFGQVFKDGDPRRTQLINAGFNILYGVGMDGYTKYFKNYIVMNRVDIDGYRLTHNAERLNNMFGLNLK